MMGYTKIIKYISYLLLLIAVVLTIVFFLNTSNLTEQSVNQFTLLDVYLGWGYFLLLTGIVSMLILPLPFMTKASYKRLGIIALMFVVLFGISYMLANGNPVNAVVDVQPTESTLKMTDAGLKFTYILFAISLLAIAFSGIYKSVVLPKLNR